MVLDIIWLSNTEIVCYYKTVRDPIPCYCYYKTVRDPILYSLSYKENRYLRAFVTPAVELWLKLKLHITV